MKETFFLVIILMLSSVLKSQEINTRTEHNVLKSGDYSIIKMSIKLNDTTQVAEASSFASKAKSSKLDFDELKSGLILAIHENENLEIYVNLPKYMDDIFNLITSQADREKAKKIFDDNNYKNAIQSSLNNSIIVDNGKTQKKITLELSIPLKVKNSGVLVLNELNFQHEGIVYTMERQEIKIEK